MSTAEQYDIQRFINAQDGAYGSYTEALREIRNGRKTGHWIWYIFPQMRGLGHSDMSDYYGIGSLEEAKEYLDNPVLKERLIEISTALLEHAQGGWLRRPKSAEEILGTIDAHKVRSSMTLFDLVMPDSVFAEVLNAFYEGKRDMRTLQILNIK